MSTRRASERGAALVEFALILPILTSLLLGMVTGGLAYNKKIAITDAVRGATRYGTTLNNTSGWATSVRDRLVQLSATELTGSDVCVELLRGGQASPVQSWYASSGNTSCPSSFGTPPATPAVNTGYCVVKVWGMKQATLQAVFFTSTLSLKAGSVGSYERGTEAGVC
jgi:Flp pilus assembly protein TadG